MESLLPKSSLVVENMISEPALYSDVKSTLLGQSTNSTQTNYIQLLTVYMADTYSTNLTILSYISQFSYLKELNLYFPYLNRHTLKVSDLLHALNGNRLETLRLHYLNLDLGKALNACAYPSLKELCLHNVTFDTGLVDVFSDIFPSLEKLKLDRSFKEFGTILLPYTDLKYLEVIHYCTKPKFHVLVITLDDNQRRLYSARTSELWSDYIFEDKFSRPSVLSLTYEEPVDTPILEVVCN